MDAFASTPPPREVEAVLVWWLPRLRSLLGGELQSVLLGGGLALGGFEPGWSDLDVCVVLRGGIPDDRARAIGRLHAEAEQRFLVEREGGWRSTQLLEGPYVSVDLLDGAGATGRFLRVATGTCRLTEGDPLPGFDRLVLAHHAIVLAGARIQLTPPARATLAASQAWLPALLAEPAPAHSAIMLAGLLQEAARSLVYWRDGRWLDKTAALEHGMQCGGSWADACRVALGVRHAGSDRATAHRPELEQAYDVAAPALCAELRARLADAVARRPDS